MNYFLKMLDGGKVNFQNIKAGAKLEDVKYSKLGSIFRALDSNDNNVIDKQELQTFLEKVKSFASRGNKENLGDKEFKELQNALGEDFKNFTKEELLNFIKYLSENTSGLKTITTHPNGETEYIYEDGSRTKVHPDGLTEYMEEDGSSTTRDKDGNITNRTIRKGSITISYRKLDDGGTEYITGDETTGVTEVEVRDKDGKIVSQSVIEDGVETKTTYLDNGVKEVSTYENGAETSVRFEDKNGVPCDRYGNPLEPEVKSQEVKETPKTTKIIVQNGESIAALAKKFRCSEQEIIDANPGLVKGNAPNQYFYAGEEITIPREVSAEALAGRQTKEEAEAAYTAMAARPHTFEAEAAARKLITWTERNYNTFEEIAKQLFKREGLANPTKEQLEARIEDLKKLNPGLKDGELKGKKIKANVNEGMYNRIKARNIKAQEYNEKVDERQNAEELAKEFYDIADNNSGYTSMKKMQAFLDEKVTADNIVSLIDAYDKAKQGDSSIIDTVTSEILPSGDKTAQKRVLRTIMAKLIEAARKAGVSEGDIKKANDDFEASIKKEYDSFSGALRRTNPLEMEKAIDFLRGAIAARKTDNVEEISDAEAINAFNEDFAANDAEAQTAYKDARAEEGWAAKVGDTVCGWFGCTTIEEMDAKLGKNAEAVKRLATAKTEEEFKAIYKEIFGIEFDKNKIAARDAAFSNYYEAAMLDSTIKVINDLLKTADGMSYDDLRSAIKEKFQLDDETVDSIIESYADSLDIQADSDDAKRTLILQFLRDTHTNSSETFMELTKGKTLEQMGKDLELLNKSAFGTNDIVKDVVQFNQNMVMTEMITEGAFEVAGTVALAFVPGLGQAAMARLAVSAAKWGNKAVKLTNTLKKAEKLFEAADKLQKGKALTSNVANRGTQIGSQMVNAGVATAAVDLSNGDEVKEVVRKTLMNMSFAGVGASSSILAPKLMKAFGIDKALANEIAEEIINAAGTYGVTKISGDDYGSADAFIDFVTGLVMARISHVKTGGSNAAVKNETQSKVKPEETGRTAGKADETAEGSNSKTGATDKTDSQSNRRDTADGAEEPKSKTNEDVDAATGSDSANNSKINAESVRQKYGEAIHNLYKEAEELIQKLKTLANYKSAKIYIKTQFGKINELMDDLLEKLEVAAKKIGLKTREAMYGVTRSKYFSVGEISDFVNNPIYNPAKMKQMMENQGFVSTEATSFRGKQGILSMYDPKGHHLYTFVFDANGNCISKSKTKVTKNADGSYTRHSDLTINYIKNRKTHAIITENNKVIYEDDFPIVNPDAASSASSRNSRSDGARGANGADGANGSNRTADESRSRASDNANNTESAKKRAEAYRKFNKNVQSVELPPNGSILNQNAQYSLDLENLPRLRLYDGTIVDLNSPEIRNRIASLREGEFITIGRDGDIKINATDSISRHHILITCHNGQIVMKDVSLAGNTSCYTSNNSYGASGASSRAEGARAAGASNPNTQRVINEARQKINTMANRCKQLEEAIVNAKNQLNKISLSKEKYIEYKNLLGIPIDEQLTPDNLKKAFRKKSIEYHPDRHPDEPEFTEKFQEINNANDALKTYLETAADRDKLKSQINAYQVALDKVNAEIARQEQIIRNAGVV